MSAYYFKKPFVMFNRVANPSNGQHPHAILGMIDDKYLSMNITHSSNVFGKTTIKLEKNPQDSYLVADDIYILPINSYLKADKGTWSGFTKNDIEKMKQAIREHKNIVK